MGDHITTLITYVLLYAPLMIAVLGLLGIIGGLLLSQLKNAIKKERQKKHKRGKKLARRKTVCWMALSIILFPLLIAICFMAIVPFANLCMDIICKSYVTYYGDYEYRDFWGWDQNCVILSDDNNKSLNTATDDFPKEHMITEERCGYVAYIGSGYVVYFEHSNLVVYIGETLE